ncbi:MAG: alpha/beta hydrolase [Pelagibacteraceae bacterium]|tara:strand:- start:2032 stop:2832 length:801 start_codon:yes stop_codon:yes gene_type:complete
MKFIYFSIISIVVIYFLIILFVYFNQRNLLYHPSENNYLDEKVKFKYEEVMIQVEKDIKLKSWLIKKDLKKNNTLLFFHGNAGNLSNRVYKLNELQKLNINILIVAWRSFSGNPGEPTEKNLYNDARKSVEWLNNNGVKNENIILYGESLGTGVAVELGKDNTFNSIILESPYTSIARAAKLYYPYLPINLLLKDRYDSISKIDKITSPILIMHGEKDNIVPFSMGKELFEKANNPKYSFFPKEDDHMMNFNQEIIKKIKTFIEKY